MTLMIESHNDLRESRGGDVERACRADELCCRICTENGLEVMHWQDFAAWKEYVDGKINDSQLSERAQVELRELAQSFGKYLVTDKKHEAGQLEEDEEEKTRQRARQANKIYRRACDEVGLKVSFFKDFKSWSDYVEGKISDSEFYEKAKRELQSLMTQSDKTSRELKTLET